VRTQYLHIQIPVGARPPVKAFSHPTVKLPDTLSFRAGSLLQKKQRTAEHPAFLLISLPAPIAVLRRCHLSIDNLFCFFQRITQATETPSRIFDLKTLTWIRRIMLKNG